MSSVDTWAVATSRGSAFSIVSQAQSLLTRSASRRTSGVRNDELHMPSEGNTSSAQMPSWSRSTIRLAMSLAPGARCVASRNSLLRPVGSFRRNDMPSMWTVSHSPSGSRSERGTSSASRGGRLSRQSSSGSRKCESPEFAQIFSMSSPSFAIVGRFK
jgi:hypothetical protein